MSRGVAAAEVTPRAGGGGSGSNTLNRPAHSRGEGGRLALACLPASNWKLRKRGERRRQKELSPCYR